MKAHREERYWSRFARSYDRDGEYVVGTPVLQAIEERLLAERSLGDVIEFGCGTGYFTKAIARNASHVVATDLSGEMLEVARIELGEFHNVTVQKADCANTSFPAERFDSVFMANLVHVIDRPSRCLRESYRILRGGGSLIVVDFTGYRMSLSKKLGLVFRYLRRWGLPPRHGRNDLSPDGLVSLVEGAGFRVEDVQLIEDGSNAVYLRGRKE
jgi:ubiquinone/menaquinone biosynthesis C-methylase UbiE